MKIPRPITPVLDAFCGATDNIGFAVEADNSKAIVDIDFTESAFIAKSHCKTIWPR